MLFKFLRYVILYLACISYLPVLAQDTISASLPAIWDLETCLQYARDNNIQINRLRLDRESSEQNLLLSKSAMLPDLRGSASQSFNHRGNGSGPVIGASGSYGLSSSLTLYNDGYFGADIRQKNLILQSAGLDLLAAENDITLQITQAYLTILLDKENIVYAQDLVSTSQAQLAQMRRSFDVGSSARKDVVQLEAQLAGDQYTLTSSQNAERQDKLNLKQLLQIPTVTSFDIVKPDTIVSKSLVPSLQQVQNFALQNRPEIKNAELGMDISGLDLEKARTAYKPTISLGGDIGTSYNNNAFNFRQFDNNFFQQVGLTLSVPIFTKRLTKTNVEQAKISIKQSELTLKDTRTVLLQAVEQAYIDVLNAQNQYNAAAEQLQYTQEIYRIANEELRLGAINIVDFYLQRNLYVQALQAYT
ncbi:MAG TPA: transporter, partial [Sphingobacteriaceae bacterium]|nr:transporter [Sphingobacteriaceae bacterium]